MEEESIKARQEIPKGFAIRVEDLNNHGYSKDCPGCVAILRGTARQGHSPECRARMARAMHGDPRVEQALLRQNEYLANQFEEQRGDIARPRFYPNASWRVQGQR